MFVVVCLGPLDPLQAATPRKPSEGKSEAVLADRACLTLNQVPLHGRPPQQRTGSDCWTGILQSQQRSGEQHKQVCRSVLIPSEGVVPVTENPPSDG